MSFRHGSRRIRNPLPEGLARQYAHHSQGVILGVLFAAGQLLQAIGLGTTQAAMNGFITSLYVVFTPLLAAVIFRKKVSTAIWGAVALATVGMGVLALDPSTLGSGFGIGQLLTLASAVAYAGHIVATGRFANPSNVTSSGCIKRSPSPSSAPLQPCLEV